MQDSTDYRLNVSAARAAASDGHSRRTSCGLAAVALVMMTTRVLPPTNRHIGSGDENGTQTRCWSGLK